jgi:hypothetical protein
VFYYTRDGKPDKQRRPGKPWDPSVFAGPEKATYSAGVGVNLMAGIVPNQPAGSGGDHSESKGGEGGRGDGEEGSGGGQGGNKGVLELGTAESVQQTIEQVALQTYLDQVRTYEQLMDPLAQIMQTCLGGGAVPGAPTTEGLGWGPEGRKLIPALVDIGAMEVSAEQLKKNMRGDRGGERGRDDGGEEEDSYGGSHYHGGGGHENYHENDDEHSTSSRSLLSLANVSRKLTSEITDYVPKELLQLKIALRPIREKGHEARARQRAERRAAKIERKRVEKEVEERKQRRLHEEQEKERAKNNSSSPMRLSRHTTNNSTGTSTTTNMGRVGRRVSMMSLSASANINNMNNKSSTSPTGTLEDMVSARSVSSIGSSVDFDHGRERGRGKIGGGGGSGGRDRGLGRSANLLEEVKYIGASKQMATGLQSALVPYQNKNSPLSARSGLSSLDAYNNDSKGITGNIFVPPTTPQDLADRYHQRKEVKRKAAEEVAKREKKIDNRRSAAIPWNLLDQLEGEKQKFHDEKNRAELFGKY